MKERAQEDKKITMLQKISYLFDRKQKMQFIGLGILILIGGLLETLGVSMMVPLVQGIMDPEALYQNEIVGKILRFLHIETADMGQAGGGNRLIIFMLAALMILFVVKNVYLLFQTYVQNTFVTRNRNRMISRVMREFLNRPYKEYLGADIPTVFRLTDSDIPNVFNILMAMISLVSEAVVFALLCVVMVATDWKLLLFLIVVFGILSVVILKILKPRLAKLGEKNLAILDWIARFFSPS